MVEFNDSPFEKVHGLLLQVELVLGVLPLVAEDQHDPGVELGEGGGDVALPRLVEDGADEPEVEGVAGQGEDVSVSSGSVLQSSAGTQLRALQLLLPTLRDLVLNKTVNKGTNSLLR